MKMYQRLLGSFCDDDNQYFLKLHRLLSSYTKLDHVANFPYLTHIANVLRGQILENRVLQNSNLKASITMILVWETGALYGLTLFSSDFIDYVE